jgi:hypothetical protein
MALDLDLRQVQKKGGRIHLAVPGAATVDVRTLCNKLLLAGDYREVDDEADCQLCRKRRSDPALVSSAFFEGDQGSQLLEMSLARARAERVGKPKLRTLPEPQAKPEVRPRAKREPKPKAEPEPAAQQPSSLGDLETANLRQVSENVYQSPMGVVIRARKSGSRWAVAEIVFDGDAQLKRSPDGGIRIKLGDVIADYSTAGGELRARYHHEETR